ncbi:MAG: DNA glycosylase [Verrucomicrobiales bacterium]
MAHPDPVPVPYEGRFSLADTLKSGQLFHWEPFAYGGIDGFAGCIGGGPVSWIGQKADGTVFTFDRDFEQARRYFGLDQPLAEIHASFPVGDPVLARAMAYCPGIRVARQPVWECLATFITSSLKQVAHIRSISMTLRERFGRPRMLGDRVFHAYPEPASLAAAGEDVLRTCALGYRAKSLHLAAVAVVSGEIDLESVAADPDLASARATLMRMHGVGEKIANCALLFGCGRWESFPIDVWIERILRQDYRKRVKGPKLQAWAVDHFGPNAGYAQQYLFHFARKTL